MPGGRPASSRPRSPTGSSPRWRWALRCGWPPLTAASAERTLHRWLEVGEAARRGAYRQFWQRVEAARAGYFVEMGEVVREGAVTDARTAPLRCRPGAPARVDLQVSGQLQVRDDEAGLALLLLDRDWCERTQEILAAQHGDIGARRKLGAASMRQGWPSAAPSGAAGSTHVARRRLPS